MSDMPLKEVELGLDVLLVSECLGETGKLVLHQAASLVRKVEVGELVLMIHAHCTGSGYDLHCSNCGDAYNIGEDYCPSCGARMDGKDGGNEAD